MNNVLLSVVTILLVFGSQSVLADCAATFTNGKATVQEGCKAGDKLVARSFDSGLLMKAERRLCAEGSERPMKDKSGIVGRFVLECRYVGWLQEKPSEGVFITGRGTYVLPR